MKRLIACILFFLVPASLAACQVPESADTLASWEPPSDVLTYTAGDDTLHVLGDSTWVALQDTVTIGCDLGPDGSFWTFQPRVITNTYISEADTTLEYGPLMSLESCIWNVQVLWRYKEGLIE